MLQLDLSGLNCPLPVLKTKKFLSELDSGTEIKIITTDSASIIDFQEFCKKTGHLLIEQHVTENTIITIIKRR